MASQRIPVDLKTLRKIVRKPKFVCGKCARSANDKSYLCQPLRLKRKKPEPPARLLIGPALAALLEQPARLDVIGAEPAILATGTARQIEVLR